MRHPTLSAVVRAYMRRRRLGAGSWVCQRIQYWLQRFFGSRGTFPRVNKVQYLAMCALGYRFPLPEGSHPTFIE